MKNFWLKRAELVVVPTGYDGEFVEFSKLPRKLLEKLKEYWQQHYASGNITHPVYVYAVEAIERLE